MLLACIIVFAGPAIAKPTADRPIVALSPGPPARAQVYLTNARGTKPVGPPFTYRHRAKMASALDIDADGCLDLLVLVWKPTRFDPKPAWRPFVYTLEDSRWVPKWLGSRVGHPLIEAALVRTPRGPRLLTVEEFEAGKMGLTLYHWRGFGFWGEWTGPQMGVLSNLKVVDLDNDGFDEITLRAANGARIHFAYASDGYGSVSNAKGGNLP